MLKYLSLVLGLIVISSSKTLAFQIKTGLDVGHTSLVGSRLTSAPNADAAKNEFLSSLDSFVTETFDDTPKLNAEFKNTSLINGSLGVRATLLELPESFRFYGEDSYDYSFQRSQHQPSTIQFSSPTRALGFYATNIYSDAIISSVSPFLRVTLSTGATKDFSLPSSRFRVPSVLYFGLTAESEEENFVSVKFLKSSTRIGYFEIDNMTVASVKPNTPVPEPLTILGSIGAGSIGYFLKRRYKVKVISQ